MRRAEEPFRSVALAMSLLLVGCVSAATLDRAVITYDRTMADTTSKQILLNIARARLNQPLHFTSISTITATYKFSFSAGVPPATVGDRGALLPIFGGSAEENPTFSIAPMQGEEFTKRLLTAF